MQRRPVLAVRPFVSLVSFAVAISLAAAVRAQGVPGGFAETFALAPDRPAALAQLVPGTEDFYFYRCLQSQHAGAFAEVPPLLAAWIEKHGRTPRVTEIENRQALLTVDRDPRATWAFLRERLSLRFDQEQQVPGARPDLPAVLDPATVSLRAFTARALQMHPNSLDGFTDAGLDAVVALGVPDHLLGELLRRLQGPDLQNLPALIARWLRQPNSGFSALPVGKRLTQAQLDELVQLVPSLLGDTAFIDSYVDVLHPVGDVSLAYAPQQRAAWLDRLWGFAQRLGPAQNSLKSQVLHERLALDLATGAPDKQRFVAYLRLPRSGWRTNPEYLRKIRRDEIVDPGRGNQALPIVNDDEPLVRACFEHFFAREDSFAEYTELVREDWLRPLFAETKMLAGQGDMERWYSMLADPGRYEQLNARVDLLFAATQPRHYGQNDKVTIDLDVKNVPKLLVKVFHIDAYEYLKAKGKDVDTAIDLDGVVANEEQVVEYTEPPLRRVRRRFEFAGLAGPGTWVVEFVGNGVSSRAVIQKGNLRALSRVGAAGHVLTVLDETGAVVKDAVAFVAGREFAADKDGEIVVPFAPAAEGRQIVLRRGEVASLQPFLHQDESYALRAGVFVDREALRSGVPATLLIRPQLQVDGVPIALDLLEDATIELQATTRDGVANVQTVRAPKWTEDGDYAHVFQVPKDLAQLTVTVRGRVDNKSRGKKDDIAAAPVAFAVAAIDQTATIETPLLGRSAAGWFVEVRGRSGEPLPGRAVNLTLRHRTCTDAMDVALATDATGKVELGALDGITTVRIASLPDEFAVVDLQPSWTLPATAGGNRSALAGVAGETLRVPYGGRAPTLDRSVATLFELRGGRPVRDASASLALVDGFVELRTLAAGDYRLDLREDGRIVDIAIADGAATANWAIGSERAVPLVGRSALHVLDLAATDDQMTFRVVNAGADARLHVFATRYWPAFMPGSSLWVAAREAAHSTPLAHSENDYVAGRVLADELRYVLERRYASRYPGNMLARPSLLLNPWSPDRQWNAAIGLGGGAGGKFGGRRGGRAGGPSAPGPGGIARALLGPNAYADVDFLAAATPVLHNLRPDAKGRVVVRRKDLGPGQQIHVVAIDGDDSVHRTLELPLQPLQPRDLTLKRALDASQHFAQQQRIEFVAAGSEAHITDVGAATIQTFTTLADVHRLLQAVTGDADLAEFAFVLRWPTLGDDEKRALYRQHACHELHFFLYAKDRAFFDAVLQPYLANKAHKEFLDQWLLGEDLQGYLQPWAFARLNLVERILLCKRLAGQGDAMQRYVRELGELLPVDLARQQLGFLTALRSGELDAGNAEALKKLLAPVADARPSLNLELERSKMEGAAKDKADRPAAAAPGAPAPARKADADAEEPALTPPAETAGLAETKVADEKSRRDADRGRRQETRAFFREPEPTRLFVEHHYWHRERSDRGFGGAVPENGLEDPTLIVANAFWRDFAVAKDGAPFVSPHFVVASGSFTEAMFALAVLDLPFTADEPVAERTGDALSLRPKSPLLLARSEILPAAAVAGADPVLIRQDCYRLDDRYVFEGNQRRQKPVAGEFLAGIAYGSQVVLTNPTEVPRRLAVLLQIPAGAVPLQNGMQVRSVPVELGAFATTTLEFAFYWPVAGDFAHYPAQVAADSAFVGAADGAVRHVVATPTTVDTASWEHVSQLGKNDEVLAFLRTQNLLRIDLSRIAWRLKDRAFFTAAQQLLRARLHYDATVWSFALLHGDVPAAQDFLSHQDAFVAACGAVLESPLLTFDVEQRAAYEHAEFEPLFHSRAHRVGPWRAIENPDVARQWQQCVDMLCYRRALRASDWAAVTYYLLLQGRIDEALATFARIDASQLATRLQYDYMAAYVAMFKVDIDQARRIAAGYRDHPVERWRLLFRDVVQQLDEVAGSATSAIDPTDRTNQQTQLAASEPQLEVAVAGGRVVVRHKNVARCELRYHQLDVEFAFSNSPFAQQGLAAIAWVQPMRTDAVDLAAGEQETAVPLPAEFQRGNVVVEVRGGGIVRRTQSLASAMTVQTSENYGQLEVRAAAGGAPLPKVYVKVYARTGSGGVRFHKDGYTDLRGRFDYASVSTQGGGDAERFALLVLSETDGAVLREVGAPGR